MTEENAGVQDDARTGAESNANPDAQDGASIGAGSDTAPDAQDGASLGAGDDAAPDARAGDGEEPEAEARETPEEPDEAARLKEAIQVETEDVGTLRKKLTITIPRETIDERLNTQFSELKREAMVPGFRKGRAPLKLIEKRFGSDVGDELVTKLVSSSYMAAVEKTELKTLGDPLIWASVPEEGSDGKRVGQTVEKLVSVEEALRVMELPAEGPLTFACEVEVRPEFELPELDGIPVEEPKVQVTDNDVDREIERIRGIYARYVPVDDAIRADDLVIADMTMRVGDRVIKEEQNVALAARPRRVEDVMLDLNEALVDRRSGDTVEVTGTFDDDHENLEYRGKDAVFTFAIHDVKRLELPAIDDQFVASLGFDDEQQLRAHTRDELEAQLISVIRRGMRGQIGKYLLDHTDLDVPTGLSRRQTERLLTRRMIDLYRQGVPEQAIDKQIDELRTQAGQDTINELKLFFIMEKIAEQMDIDVADDEFNGAIAMIAQHQNKRFDRVRDELAKDNGLTALYLRLRDDKTLDALLAKANVTPIEPKKTGSKKTTADAAAADAGRGDGVSPDKADEPCDEPGKSAKEKKDT